VSDASSHRKGAVLQGYYVVSCFCFNFLCILMFRICNCAGGSFTKGKESRAWSLPFTAILCWG